MDFGAGVGFGFGVDVGCGAGVGFGFGVASGFGFGVGSGFGVEAGVGVGVGFAAALAAKASSLAPYPPAAIDTTAVATAVATVDGPRRLTCPRYRTLGPPKRRRAIHVGPSELSGDSADIVVYDATPGGEA